MTDEQDDELTSFPAFFYFPPPWDFYEYPEKTEGWIEFQREMRKDPKYYLSNIKGITYDR